jgi:hypothetical protein
MSLIKSVKSNLANFWLTIFGVLILSPNVFYVFYKISVEMPWPYLREAQAAGVALYVSWSIVYNTLKGNLKIAFRFALFEVFISICYYWLRLMFETGSFEWNWYIIPAFAFALMLPLSLKEGASYIKDEDSEALTNEQRTHDWTYKLKDGALSMTKEPIAPLVDPEFIKELKIKVEEFKAVSSELGKMKIERDAAIDLTNKRAVELLKSQAEATFHANSVRESGLIINDLTKEIEALKSKAPDQFKVEVVANKEDEFDDWGK